MLLVAVLVLLVTLLYLQTRKPKGFPPGPPRYPIVGYGPFLEKHNVHKHLWRLSSTYGPVVGIYFGPQRTVVVNGWEAVKESLANDDLNGRPSPVTLQIRDGGKIRGEWKYLMVKPLTLNFTILLGEEIVILYKSAKLAGFVGFVNFVFYSVVFTDGDLWKEQRRFSLHHFRNLGFGKRSHEAVIHEEAVELIKEIEDTDEGVELQIKFGVSLTNILWALMGGTRFHRSDQRLIDLVAKLNDMFRAGEVAGNIVNIIPAVRHILPKSAKFSIVAEGFTSVMDFIKKSVAEHRATLEPDNPRDFIDIFLAEMLKQKDNKESTFNEDQLVSLCTDIFSAGTETGSASVSFAVLMSTLHPKVMKKIHEELDDVVGQERLPSIDDRPKLAYTDAVLTEIFRFRGAAPFTVPHCASRDTTLQGYAIPAGTMVMNSLYSIRMDKEYWGDPENFRPERFLNSDGTLRRDERMIPFGKGRRSCLGESLARMTVYLLFTALMQKFTFTIDPSVYFADTEGTAGFTLGPPRFKVFARSRF